MKTDCVCTPEKVDYIISYRESSADRKAALLYVTSWVLNAFPEINIIVVEQDNRQKLVKDELPGCQLIFIFNEGLFNRSWSNNVGAVHGARPFLVFADCDIFLKKQAYQACFDALGVFDAVDPKKSYITNVDLSAAYLLPSKQVKKQRVPDYKIKNKRFGNTFAGGIFFIRRQSLIDIGLWDETFEGWGGEDNVMEHVIRLFLRQCRLQLEVFHIDHLRTVLDTKSQPQYQLNSERCRAICGEHGPAMLVYIEDKKQAVWGATDKYRDQNAHICAS